MRPAKSVERGNALPPCVPPRDKVDKYNLCIDAGKSLDPIVIDGVADIEKTLYIKMADGQHRLQASYEKGTKYVVALDTPGAREAQKFLENLA